MSEVYLEVNSGALRQKAATVYVSATAFTEHVDDARGLAELANPLLGVASIAPSVAFGIALHDFEQHWAQSLRQLHDRTAEISTALSEAADGYDRSDLLPVLR